MKLLIVTLLFVFISIIVGSEVPHKKCVYKVPKSRTFVTYETNQDDQCNENCENLHGKDLAWGVCMWRENQDYDYCHCFHKNIAEQNEEIRPNKHLPRVGR